MKFRTEYQAPLSSEPLDPEQPIVLIGSCFTDYIGERMRKCRWRAFPNIAGTLFNPGSIANILELAMNPYIWDREVDDSITMREGREERYVSWLTDSKTSSYSMEETREKVITRLQRLDEALRVAKALIVTFGTSWIYELASIPGYIVSNCHKFPGADFKRRRLTVGEITERWVGLIKKLNERYPHLRVIFTVSPVRHLKDGFEGNCRSKAVLQLACEEIIHAFPKAEYFPAFEIMNDDLRDYRFYSSDLVHPSEEAIEYIWEKFQDRYLTPQSRKLLAEGEKVTKRLAHRPQVYEDTVAGQYRKAAREREVEEDYRAFIEAHPGMLRITE